MGVVLLREARERAGLSREALAFRAGLSPRAIYDIEHARTVPRRSTRLLLTTALRHELGVDLLRIDWPNAVEAEAA